MKRPGILHHILTLTIVGLIAIPVAVFPRDPVHAQPVTATLHPVADSYVNESSPGTNYGTATQIRTDNSPQVRSYLTFAVSGVTGTVTAATLRIYANSNHGAGFEVRSADSSWTETAVNYTNQPSFSGTVTGSSGPLVAGNWHTVNVTPLVTGNGEISLVLTTTSSTAMSLASRESATKPELIITFEDAAVPTPTPTVSEPTNTPSPTPTATPPTPTPTPASGGLTYIVTATGITYSAVSQNGQPNYSGTNLKQVIESAVGQLQAGGGGTVRFMEGIFDLGTNYFKITDKHDITFEGQGMDITVLKNNTDAAADTEPFNMTRSDRIVIRDMTIVAQGAARSTSDAIDFDDGSDNVVERVKITDSRARGIVFDGKDAGGDSQRNIVRDSVITGIDADGIELLASSNNQLINNLVTDVGGHGIQVNKASSSAPQPNKQSNNNLVSGNTIDNSGQHGIDINSGGNNTVMNNYITNSGNLSSSRDGIRISSTNSVSCNANNIVGNTATDNQTVKTQNYGLHIASSLCNGTTVSSNTFTGNKTGTVKDLGTNTQFL